MQSLVPNEREFIIDMGDGIILKPKKPFPETKLDDVSKSVRINQTRLSNVKNLEIIS
jgi:hypothetical protein